MVFELFLVRHRETTIAYYPYKWVIFTGKYHNLLFYQCISYLCAGEPLVIWDEDYENDFRSLKPDEKGHICFDKLIIYLVLNFGYTYEVALDILQNIDKKNKQFLNKYQFNNMMRKLKGIKQFVVKKSKDIFYFYDIITFMVSSISTNY